MNFDAPLDALAECHGRLQQRCEALRQLSARLEVSAPDAASGRVAATLRRDFERSTARLHQDEERDLFPALLESMAGSDAVCIHQMIDARAQEHREIEQRWLALGQWLESIEHGRPAPALAGAVDAFVTLCMSHLEQEDLELLPMAQRLLSDEALDEIGAAMRRRHASA